MASTIFILKTIPGLRLLDLSVGSESKTFWARSAHMSFGDGSGMGNKDEDRQVRCCL